MMLSLPATLRAPANHLSYWVLKVVVYGKIGGRSANFQGSEMLNLGKPKMPPNYEVLCGVFSATFFGFLIVGIPGLQKVTLKTPLMQIRIQS